MASTKISAMTAATSLDGSEVIPLVQSSTNKKVTLDNLFIYYPKIKLDDSTSAGSFTNAGSGANAGVVLFSTTGSARGIEFLTSASGSGSGVRTRATSSGWLLDVRSNSASWTNAVQVGLAGDATFNGGVALLNGTGITFGNFLLYSPSGTTGYIRDTANGRMQIAFDAGNSNETASATFSCASYFQGTVNLQDVNCTTGTTTGTKWGTATTQKQAWWNAAPVVQPAHIADPAGGAVIDAECRTAVNAILEWQATLGFTAAS